MRRFFVKNLLFVLAVNILVKPAWIFLIDRTVQNRVGNADYGTYLALFNLSVIFQIILDFGLTNYNSRAIAREPDKLGQIFPSMLSARVVLAVLYMALTCIMGIIMGYGTHEMLMLAAVLVFQSLSALMQFFRSNVAGLHKFRTDGVLSILDRFLMIIVCGILLLIPATGDHFKIEWFVYVQIACYAAGAIVSYIVLKKIAKTSFKFTMHLPNVLKIMRESLPYAALIFLMSIYTRVDTIMLKRMLGTEGDVQNGIYAHSYRLLDMGNMFGVMFASMLLPMFGRMLLQKENIQPLIQLCVNILLPLSVMVAVASGFYGAPLIQALYHHATESEGLLFALLMASFPAFCMMYVYSTLLTANGSMRLLISIAAVGVVLNICLNLWLIPLYQAVGAAISALITQTAVTVGFIVFSGKKLRLPFNARWIAAHAAFIVIAILAGYCTDMLQMEWYINMAMYGLICLGLMFAFRFVSVKAIMQLANR